MLSGEIVIRSTACVVFGLYVAALALRIVGRINASRVCWKAGAVGLSIHIGCAFQFAHHWSHAAAYEATASQTAALTGWHSGMGLYLNYLAMVVWLADAFGGRSKSTATDWVVQGFLAFMWFNATVVFGHGPACWLGVAAVGLLAGLKWTAGRRI